MIWSDISGGKPAGEVWGHFKDYNKFQSEYIHLREIKASTFNTHACYSIIRKLKGRDIEEESLLKYKQAMLQNDL